MLELLGSLQLVKDGQKKPIAFTQTSSLLVYLAYQSDWVSRKKLYSLYWPDMREARSLYKLRQIIYRVRKLSWVEGLEVSQERLRWKIKTDAHSFEQALKQAQWKEAIEHYGGSFLAGQSSQFASFDTWLELIRQDLASAWLKASLHHAEDLEGSSQFAEALPYLQNVLKSDPLSEQGIQILMRCFCQMGKKQEALEAYTEFKDHLAESLALEPNQETSDLASSIRQGGPLLAYSHNLPSPVTFFVGRKKELAFIKERMADPTVRLLSIIGPGGVGKTRLALKAAWVQLARFKQGVYFISLLSVHSAEEILFAIADALSLTYSQQGNPKAQLLDYLREKEILLVLDNVEHLLNHRGLLLDLIEEAKHLCLLLTSREQLKLRAEWVLVLQGLPVPELGDVKTNSSVELFIKSSQRTNPQLSLDEDNLIHIAKICRLVDGFPLALELAAAWVQMLNPQEIAEGIRRDLSFLASNLQDIPIRQRSMRAVFEASWQQLSRKEQETVKKLSVFSAGFSKSAALSVAGASARDLLNLVQRSLLRQKGKDRFELHELLRQFTEEKLATVPSEFELAKLAMSRYYLEVLASLKDRIHSPEQLDVLIEISADIANIRKAILRSPTLEKKTLEKKTLEKALFTLDSYYHLSGKFKEAQEVFTQILSLCRGRPLGIQCQLYLAAAMQKLGEMKASKAVLEEVGSAPTLASSEAILRFQLLAKQTFFQGQFKEAKQYYQQGLSLSHKQGENKRQRLMFFSGLGDVALKIGQWQQAQSYYQKALGLARHYPGTKALAITLGNLADLSCAFGDYATAMQYFQESLSLRQDLEDSYGTALMLNNMATVHHIKRRFEQAKILYQESLSLCEQLGDRPGLAYALGNLGELAFDQGNLQEAIALLSRSLTMSLELGLLPNAIKSRIFLASVYLENAESVNAKIHLKIAMEQALGLGAEPLILEVLLAVARLFLREGNRQALPLLLQHPSSHEDIRIMARELPSLEVEAIEEKGCEVDLQAYAENVLAGLDKLPDLECERLLIPTVG